MAQRRSPEEVRAALFESAARLVAQRGPAGTNSNEIAREAGVGVGSFYRHFRDKRDLLEALQREMTHALHDRTRLASAFAGDLESEVRALVEAAVSLAEEYPEAFRVLAGGTVPRSTVRLSLRPVEKRLADLSSAGHLDPAIDPQVAAKAFDVMQEGVLAWWLEDPRRAPREALVETLVHLHPALAGSALGSERRTPKRKQDLASRVE